jgi:hypothetical protein
VAASSTIGGSFDNLIPVNRLVAYVRDPDPGVWVGNSILRPAYKHWLLKDELIRIHAVASRRNGMGTPVATSTSEPSPKIPSAIKRYQKLASRPASATPRASACRTARSSKYVGVTAICPATSRR